MHVWGTPDATWPTKTILEVGKWRVLGCKNKLLVFICYRLSWFSSVSTWHKLELSGKMSCQLRRCPLSALCFSSCLQFPALDDGLQPPKHINPFLPTLLLVSVLIQQKRIKLISWESLKIGTVPLEEHVRGVQRAGPQDP